jgi:hypothetical protein
MPLHRNQPQAGTDGIRAKSASKGAWHIEQAEKPKEQAAKQREQVPRLEKAPAISPLTSVTILSKEKASH